jgi:putative transposase
MSMRGGIGSGSSVLRWLEVNPSTYYAGKVRAPSARAVRDQQLSAMIHRVWTQNRRVYGARKVWKQLRREGDRGCSLHGRAADAPRGVAWNPPREALEDHDPGSGGAAAGGSGGLSFVAERPNQLWVADITYVTSWSGRCYAAFVTDVYSRMIVGWALTTYLRTELALEALEMAVWRRNTVLDGLVHHSDRGSQYTSIRYTERLAETGIEASVGSRGDSYDNALAESTIGLFKTEIIQRQRPWKTPEEVEFATLEWIDWWNNRRLHSAIGNVPPAEFEASYYANASPMQTTGIQR